MKLLARRFLSNLNSQTKHMISPTEKIVNNLISPTEEHVKVLKKYTEQEKRIAIREKMRQIEQKNPNSPFFDMFMRSHTYLRISLTEKCNFRCLYCMPEEGVPLNPHKNLLSNDEIFRLVRLFAAHGIDKVRLTGGEPTIRKDLAKIVETISGTRGIKEVGITTNGLILHRILPNLISSGLTKINISLDTLDRQKFAKMTRRDGFEKVWKSIEFACGLLPKVKLNVVVMKNQNDNEILDFISLTQHRNLDVRFIEFMPFGGNNFGEEQFVGYSDMLTTIAEKHGENLERLQDSPNDTTKAFKIKGYKGQFGFITSMSHHFCNTCNRLRITADGNLKVCLHGQSEVSLRDRIRDGSTDEALSEIIQKAVNNKKARHADFRNGKLEKHAKSTNDSYWRINRESFKDFVPQHSYPLHHIFSIPSLSSHSQSIRFISTSPSSFRSSNIPSSILTHVDNDGQARQVDVSSKQSTIRTAVAEGTIKLTPEVSILISENRIKKGDVLNVAKISSILASKQVASLIPLCHPIRLDFVDTVFHHDLENCTLKATSTAKCFGNTGVEMEALTACTIALLTVYDMCKAVSQTMVISDIRLIHKSGGKTTYNINIDNENQI